LEWNDPRSISSRRSSAAVPERTLNTKTMPSRCWENASFTGLLQSDSA
jgi:hypothetical protein